MVVSRASRGEQLSSRGRALELGVVLFLASELMFFAAWFAAYYDLRGHVEPWPPPDARLSLTEPTIGTAILAASSVLVALAIGSLRKRRFGATRTLLGCAILGGVAFLSIAVHGWLGKTFSISSSAYGSVFFSMTGFHALHVLAGIVLMVYLLAGATEPAFRGERAAGAEGIGYYWHFVFVVWLGIYATIYLER